MPNRKRIPKGLELDILYNSGYACAICQRQNVQIHHIDKNNSNNDSQNLIVLCQEHHGEAHTKRELTTSLSEAKLRHAKKAWELTVSRRRTKVASVSYQKAAAGDFLSHGVDWGYINHRKVASLADPALLEQVDQNNFWLCKERGLVDSGGLIISGRSTTGTNYTNSSIYDTLQFGDDHRVHKLYCELVDAIASKFHPLHVSDESWSKSWVRHFIRPGCYIFLNRRHFFRKLDVQNDNIVRLAYCFRRGVSFEYIIETRNMFGVSAMTVSFAGTGVCAALAMVKSVEQQDRLTVKCTPVALGTGRWPLGILDISPDAKKEISPNIEDKIDVIAR